ncbi:MAG: UvrD-helicase domain-containing protein [Paludibacteraceae bacterium]
MFKLAQGDKSDYRSVLMTEFTLTEDEVNQQSKKILIRILHDYSAFSISTIDTFFQQVLRNFAREIGINGGYNLELDTEETLENAVDALFQDLSKEDNKQLLQWMTKYAEEKVEQSENWNIRTNILELGKEIFKENYQYKAEETNKKLHDKLFLNEYIGKIKKTKADFEKQATDEAVKALDILKRHNLTPDDFSRSMMHKTLGKYSK